VPVFQNLKAEAFINRLVDADHRRSRKVEAVLDRFDWELAAC